MLVCGEHAADRLLRSQKLQAGSPYLFDEQPPTPTQIGAVLHSLADHSLLMHLETSKAVAALGADRVHLGPAWGAASAKGRFLQRMGAWLEQRAASDAEATS